MRIFEILEKPRGASIKYVRNFFRIFDFMFCDLVFLSFFGFKDVLPFDSV